MFKYNEIHIFQKRMSLKWTAFYVDLYSMIYILYILYICVYLHSNIVIIGFDNIVFYFKTKQQILLNRCKNRCRHCGGDDGRGHAAAG